MFGVVLCVFSVCVNIEEYSPDKPNFFRRQNEPVLALFYDLPMNKSKRSMRQLHRLAELVSGVTLVTCNCDEYPDVCLELFVEPLPGFRLFTSHRAEPYEFTNEHSLFPLLDFVKYGAKAVSSLIESPKLENVTAENYVEVSTGGNCNVIAYTLPRDRMSQLFAPTMRELAHIYKDEVDMNFGVVNCSANMSFCRGVGIDAAPIVRVYRNGEYVDYEGVREIPYLVGFINEKCHRFRNDEGVLVYPHKNVVMAVYEKFAAANHEEREEMIKKYSSSKSLELFVNTMKRIERDGVESIHKGIEMCDRLLADSKLEGISRQKVEAEKQILVRFERVFKTDEL